MWSSSCIKRAAVDPLCFPVSNGFCSLFQEMPFFTSGKIYSRELAFSTLGSLKNTIACFLGHRSTLQHQSSLIVRWHLSDVRRFLHQYSVLKKLQIWRENAVCNQCQPRLDTSTTESPKRLKLNKTAGVTVPALGLNSFI